MRQWLCNPSILCTKHLLGEHVEHHMFAGTINKGTSIQGYLDNNLLEINLLKDRHDHLVTEMERRGMNHKSPLPYINTSSLTDEQLEVTIHRYNALMDLLSRCPKCKERSLQWI